MEVGETWAQYQESIIISGELHECADQETRRQEATARETIAEILTAATGASCPNCGLRCVKSELDCNAMSCAACANAGVPPYFCYLCSAQLGNSSQVAHESFTPDHHHNPRVGCELFEGEEDSFKRKATLLIQGFFATLR